MTTETYPPTFTYLYLHWSEIESYKPEIVGWGGDDIWRCRTCTSQGYPLQLDTEEAPVHERLHQAVAVAMTKLAEEVKGMPTWDMGEPGGQNVGALACNWHAVLVLIEKATP